MTEARSTGEGRVLMAGKGSVCYWGKGEANPPRLPPPVLLPPGKRPGKLVRGREGTIPRETLQGGPPFGLLFLLSHLAVTDEQVLCNP